MSFGLDVSDALSLGKRRRFLEAARHGLRAALQPIVDYDTGNVYAYEGLARAGEEMSQDGPHDIFREAEALDCVFDIDMLLADRAITGFSRLRGEGWSLLFLNLHGGLLERWEEVRDTLTNHLGAQGLKPKDVCIELSEANQTLPMEALARTVRGLRSAGFQVAVDDFGTGQSGLLMLYHAEPDFLKIDRFFIQSIPDDAKKRLLVGSIVDLAHTLGIRVIAEGIETAAELAACRDIRCDLAQGYFIARPDTQHENLERSYPMPAHRKGPVSSKIDLRPFLETIPHLTVRSRLRDLFELIRASNGQRIIPFLDEAGAPRGALREVDVRSILFSPYGRELVLNDSLDIPLSTYVRPILTVDVHTGIAPMLDLIADTAADGVLVTEAMRYIGYLSSAALVQLANEVRLNEASSQNPLSGLPGNEAISAQLETLAVETARRRLCAYIDIDNFKPFNDRYGFEVGDRAILLCAAELKALQREFDAFVGHVGGDDFFVSAAGAAVDPLIWRLDAFRDRFANAAEGLYSSEDRERGVIPGRARDGTETEFPLLSCTVATLVLAEGEGGSAGSVLSARLADLKAEAKRERLGALHGGMDGILERPERRSGAG